MNNIKEPSPELDVLAKAAVDAAIEVHRNLGPGFLESVYEEAMAIELKARGIPFERQKPISVTIKAGRLGRGALISWWRRSFSLS